MKIKSLIKIKSIVLFALCMGSCSDFLEQSNPNYLSTDNYYSTVSECSGALNAVYNAFKDTSNFTSATKENFRADMGIQAQVGRSAFTEAAYLQNFTNAYSTASEKWASIYTGIFRANQVLEGCETLLPSLTSESDIEDLNQIMAQAYLLRGLFYFWLNTTFNGGAVPYLDSVSQLEADYYNRTLESDRIIAYYRADLNKAIDLGLNDKWESGDVGRVTSWAAKAILGKSYLYEENYEMARSYFKDIIDNGGFSLMDNIGDNFTSDNEFNDESLLEISYSATYNTEFGDWSDSSQYNWFGMLFSKVNAWLNIVPPFWLIDEFENKEIVDTQNFDNWVEMDFDDIAVDGTDSNGDAYKKDVIYDQCGETFGDEYLAVHPDTGEEVIYKYSYVYHQLASDTDYDNNIYERVSLIDPDTNELYTGVDENVTYSEMFTNDLYNPLKYVKIQWIGGVPYRLKQYSTRASYSMAINGDEELPYYQKTVNRKAGFHNQESGYYRKHTNWDKWEGESLGSPSKASSINFRLIRLADIYLMYAEALIEGGSKESGFSEAMVYVNRVRERAGVVLIGSETLAQAEFFGDRSYQDTDIDGEKADSVNDFVGDASTLMQHLMYKERPLELCVEGNAIRAIDLKRWGVTKERFTTLSQQKWIFYQINYLTPYDNDNEDTDIDETKKLYKTSNWGKQKDYTHDLESTSYVDYVEAAMNYSSSVADWAIPSTETTTNPSID
ncbi:MAG: RagB/SusD family nutrient uptake outer membrane protein [Rikenellaceae bacterium]